MLRQNSEAVFPGMSLYRKMVLLISWVYEIHQRWKTNWCTYFAIYMTDLAIVILSAIYAGTGLYKGTWPNAAEDFLIRLSEVICHTVSLKQNPRIVFDMLVHQTLWQEAWDYNKGSQTFQKMQRSCKHCPVLNVLKRGNGWRYEQRISWAMDTKIALECRKLGSQLSHLMKALRKYRKQPRLNFVLFTIRPFHFIAFAANYFALYWLMCRSLPPTLELWCF